MERGKMWCVLRTAGRNTLALAESLADAGFCTWTPIEQRRYPGHKAKREVAIMPTFVFAEEARLRDLLELAEAPGRRHPEFSLFRHNGRIPVIAEAELAQLRREEQRAEVRANGPAFGAGDTVRASEGPYTGLSGKVEEIRGEWSIVFFGWQRVKISCFHLQPTEVISSGQALRRNAA